MLLLALVCEPALQLWHGGPAREQWSMFLVLETFGQRRSAEGGLVELVSSTVE